MQHTVTYLRVVLCCRGTGSQFTIIAIPKSPNHHAIKRHHQRVIETT